MANSFFKSERQYRTFSKAVREAANLTGMPYPIIDVDGFSEPKLKGRPAYYTTPSGKTRIWHPNSYNWPKTRHNSTLHIEVGRGWLIEKGLI